MSIREEAIKDLMDYKGFQRLPTENIVDHLLTYLKAEIEKSLLTDKEMVEIRKPCEHPVFKAGQEPDGEIAFIAVDEQRTYRKIAQAQLRDILKLLEEK